MASNVRLADTVNSLVVQGWIVEDISSELRTYPDAMPISTMSSDATFLMDLGGRERVVSFKGLFREGTALGTGTGMTVTALEDQVSAFEDNFINYSSYASGQFELRIYNASAALSQTYEGMVTSCNIKRVNPIAYTFNIQFTEGEMII